MDASKGMSEDMTSLFLPDISHQNTKRRVNPQPESSLSSRMDNKSDIDVTFPLNSLNNSQSNFANFLNNNDFITWKLPTEMNNQLSGYPSGTTTPGNPNPPINFADNLESHGHNHYSNLVPYEALPHHFHHHASSNLLFPNGNSQTQPFSKPIDGNWLSTSGTEIDRNLFDTKISGQNLNYAELMDQNSMLLHQLQQQIQQQNIHGQTTQLPSDFTPNSSLYVNDIDQSNFQKLDQENPSRTPEKKKRAYKTKSRSKSLLSLLTFDYSSLKLTKLLDLKCKSLNLDYKLTDQKGNDIKINFQGFLNGRVLTNDLDNSTFVHGIVEQHGGGANLKNVSMKMDPKVLSCYRRNFIQVFLNFNLEGFKHYNETDSKILKLQTSEYGYNISRVVKWFKIEISATSNSSKTGPVPIIITEDSKDKTDTTHSQSDEHICPQVINTSEQVVSINKATVQNSKIENFYTVKKLQFKSATPNNGNMAFQNYYYLRFKLSAVVADLYFDDYIDEDFAATTDTSRNEIQLFELESEPITVRGRNPSFYAERKDVLVKGRPPNVKTSYDLSKKADAGSKAFDDIISQLNNNVQSNEVQQGDSNEEKDDDSEDNASNEPGNDDDNDEDNISDDMAVKESTSGLPILPANYSQKKSIPPVIYNANSSVDLEAILENLNSQGNPNSNYKYFPISNVYYLPPVNVVYFPHGAHQGISKIKNTSPINGEDKNVTRRKSSNVYFK